MLANREAQIRRMRIRFMGQDYEHDALYGLNCKVLVKYSLFKLSKILIYMPTGEFVCEANKVEKLHPLAVALGNEANKEELQAKLQNQKALEKKTKISSNVS